MEDNKLPRITTIKLERETKARLDKLRENKRETYDEIIKKVLWILNMVRVEPDNAKKKLQAIDDSKKHFMEIKKSLK